MKGWGVRALAVQIGFTAAVAQIVLVRELMVVFSGNEVSLGMVLASWLAWTAAGSALAGRARNPRRLIVLCEPVLAMALPAAVLAIRAVRPLLHALPGEMLGPLAMFLVAFAVAIPVCLPLGALFSAGSRLSSGGVMYLLDALGCAAGGALAGLVLVERLGSLEIAWALGGIALLPAAMAARSSRARRAATASLILWCAGAMAISKLEAVSAAYPWTGFSLVQTRNSPYGNLAVVNTGGTLGIYENGLHLATASDPEAAEEAAHYALLEHPAPRRVLMIGGGINGSLVQALRHPGIERLDYVELDPAVLDLARRHFPGAWQAISRDPRVHVKIADARLFLATSSSPYDVIVVNLPDPRTAQLNRFYTLEFFQESARRLPGTGVLALQLSASENYISPQTAAFLRSIYKTLRAAFPETAVIPGGTVHLFGAQRPGVLASGAAELLQRLKTRGVHSLYVSEYYLPFRMMPDRVADLESQLRPLAETPLNRDFAPVAYYFNIALWSGRFRSEYAEAFRALAQVSFPAVAAGMAALMIPIILFARGASSPPLRKRAEAGFATASMGFVMIGLEILLLLGFQALFGSIYQHVALLTAAFMAGMAAGSWVGSRWRATSLAGPQILGAAAPLLLVGILQTASRWSGSAAAPYWFPLLAALCGGLGGYQFQSALRAWAAEGKRGHAGSLYALDLAGSCAGAILLSAWFIPVFGFFRTALLMALASLAPVAMPPWTGLRTKRGRTAG